ncbi:MAG: hypothetical protein ACLVJB_05595 [Christensenellales bacterium]
MPKKKDAAIIGVVLLLAVALFAVSKMMPKTDLSTKTAEDLAPDAVEYRRNARAGSDGRNCSRRKP